ncbi:ATP-binding cassette domain-containing protein [Pelagibius sp.]|uniref:ATP-binding cassette domain-containing protein n=1 Tax=Pelagibius sp. TaxID=1931238 RepID=UPI002633CB8C|nr:ATP-binding cassette domain-containing protein [Pelagibius sp.]
MTVVSVAKEHGLVLRQVELAHGGQRLLGPLSLTVAPGEVVTVMGPSGCGKSSLLAFVCGTLDPALEGSGRILLNGEDISRRLPEERHVGILFQDDLLFPHLSVAGNLAFGLPPQIRDRRARRARIEEALAEADMAEFYDRDPATLSGGQRARVALLRTLLSEPCALLLDEPFAKLDVALRARFRSFVFDHARAQALPTLLVTHDPQDALDAGGPVLEIDAAGKVCAGTDRPLEQRGPEPRRTTE